MEAINTECGRKVDTTKLALDLVILFANLVELAYLIWRDRQETERIKTE